MMENVIGFSAPFVVFFGDAADPTFAKTGLGLAQWRPQDCIGQVGLPGCGVDAGVPHFTLQQAREAGARSLVIGSAAVGGQVPASWVPALCEAAAMGFEIVAGLHVRLGSLPGLAEAAARGGARLVDIRVPPPGLPVGTGRKRSGRRLLTVGTDCACGKKYTALALDAEMKRRGLDSDFRATGQTGIMIAGRGLPLDAVVADFLTGAAEVLSPDNRPGHWDMVEGQGSLFHPGYLQVTVGLLVGTQPDAIVVCHQVGRNEIDGWPGFKLPTLQQLIDRAVLLGSLTNPAIRCVGVSLNTSGVPVAERAAVMAAYAAATGLPVVDPLVEGMGPVIDRLLQEFPA